MGAGIQLADKTITQQTKLSLKSSAACPIDYYGPGLFDTKSYSLGGHRPSACSCISDIVW